MGGQTRIQEMNLRCLDEALSKIRGPSGKAVNKENRFEEG